MRIHRPQQSNHGELAALVDADGDAVLLRRIDFDPATALGNHSTAKKPAFACFHFGYEVDTRAAIRKFTALFEPLIILVMGIVVGVLILSMLLAITSINDVAV